MPFPTIRAPRHFWKLALFGTPLLTLALSETALAQPASTPLVRFAELDVDKTRLEAFVRPRAKTPRPACWSRESSPSTPLRKKTIPPA
jgi:hypothetical protein